MKMPASFAEFSDALQKARIKDGSFCKNELTCIHYNGLTHAMIGWNANLYDLNLFAQRLASLTEEQKKGMDALLKIKQNHRVAPIPLNQLINLTYNTDICCFAPRVSNHEELGAFLYANEMLSNIRNKKVQCLFVGEDRIYTETTLLGKIIQQEASYCVKKVIHRFPPPARAPRQKKMQNRTFLPSSREPGECNSRCQRVVHVPYTHSGMEA